MSGEALSTREVAKQLGVSDVWVCYLCRTGQLPARRFGKSWMIHRDDLRRYIERREKAKAIG